MHYGGHGNTNKLDAAAALFELGRSCRQAGDLLQAQGLLKECLQMQRGLHGNTHHLDIAGADKQVTCRGAEVHGGVLADAARPSCQQQPFGHCIRIVRLGCLCTQAADLPQAQKFLKECSQMQRGLHGNIIYFEIASALFELGRSCRQAGDLPQAQKFLEECLQMQCDLYIYQRPVWGHTRPPGHCSQGELRKAQEFLKEFLQMLPVIPADIREIEIPAERELEQVRQHRSDDRSASR
ncbi:unnamed protein product [Effrenium voratum]|nr:unnamed protein product [Effrenium voratum]